MKNLRKKEKPITTTTKKKWFHEMHHFTIFPKIIFQLLNSAKERERVRNKLDLKFTKQELCCTNMSIIWKKFFFN